MAVAVVDGIGLLAVSNILQRCTTARVRLVVVVVNVRYCGIIISHSYAFLIGYTTLHIGVFLPLLAVL
jgi:hypothetical protein